MLCCRGFEVFEDDLARITETALMLLIITIDSNRMTLGPIMQALHGTSVSGVGQAVLFDGANGRCFST